MSTNRAGLPSAAVMQVPGWLWGGDPPQYFAAAGLRCRPVPDRPDAWRVQTEERYRQHRPTLVTADHLAGPAVRRPRFDLLDVVARDALVDTEGGQLEREIAQRAQCAAQNGTFVDAIPLWQLRCVRPFEQAGCGSRAGPP